MLEGDAGAARDAVVGVGGELGLYARTTVDQFRHLPELATAPGQDDAVIDDVSGELGRGLLQDLADSLCHLTQFSCQRIRNLVGGEFYCARQAGDLVAPLSRYRELLTHRHCGAYLYLELLGRLVANDEIMLSLHVVGDGAVKSVASTFNRCRCHDATEGDHGHIDGAAADVDNHTSHRLLKNLK